MANHHIVEGRILHRKSKDSFSFSIFSNDILKSHFIRSSALIFNKSRLASALARSKDKAKQNYCSVPSRGRSFTLESRTRFRSTVFEDKCGYDVDESYGRNRVCGAHQKILLSQSVDKAIRIMKIGSHGKTKRKLMGDSYHLWPLSGSGQKSYAVGTIRRCPLVRKSLQFSFDHVTNN